MRAVQVVEFDVPGSHASSRIRNRGRERGKAECVRREFAGLGLSGSCGFVCRGVLFLAAPVTSSI